MIMVRIGNAGDVEGALAVWRAANAARRKGEQVSQEHEARARRYLATVDAFFFVAEEDSTIVGLALAMQARERRGAGAPIAGMCQLGLVSVEPDHSGLGIAKQMYTALLGEAVSRGYVTAQVWTQIDNGAAQRLYKAFGFLATGRQRDDEIRGQSIQYELTAMDTRKSPR